MPWNENLNASQEKDVFLLKVMYEYGIEYHVASWKYGKNDSGFLVGSTGEGCEAWIPMDYIQAWWMPIPE